MGKGSAEGGDREGGAIYFVVGRGEGSFVFVNEGLELLLVGGEVLFVGEGGFLHVQMLKFGKGGGVQVCF